MKRKGITPVIAIVLLLLITVGAVGVVYTQFQSLTGNPSQQLAQQQKVRNTQLAFASVYSNDTSNTATNDAINISLRNTGSVTVNMSKQFNIAFSPTGTDGYIAHDIFPDTAGPNRCFQPRPAGDGLLNPGETYTCNTGIQWPAATETVGIQVSFKTADKSWSYTCSPSTSSSVAC
ncbi:MAG: archaellin/type IV pilin N-terminal domain-containing protein [Candidatus Nanohaloarchaea archaeon]